MLLVKARPGFVVVSDPTGHKGVDFTRALLEYLFEHQIEFLIGGEQASVIITINESRDDVSAALIRWWHDRSN